MRHLRAALVGVIVAAGMTVAAGRDSARVTINNRQKVVGFPPLEATIVARIDTPTEDFFCPEVEVIFTDGTRAVRESDCEPWDEIPAGWRFSSEPVVRWLGPGEHRIEVYLRQGKRERRFELQATVYE